MCQRSRWLGPQRRSSARRYAHQGKEYSLKRKFGAVAPVYQALHGKQLTWSEFVDDENQARNAAKHIKLPTDPTVTMDIEDAAVWMLVRACDNFIRLGLPQTDRMVVFENWFYEHVIGV